MKDTYKSNTHSLYKKIQSLWKYMNHYIFLLAKFSVCILISWWISSCWSIGEKLLLPFFKSFLRLAFYFIFLYRILDIMINSPTHHFQFIFREVHLYKRGPSILQLVFKKNWNPMGENFSWIFYTICWIVCYHSRTVGDYERMLNYLYYLLCNAHIDHIKINH